MFSPVNSLSFTNVIKASHHWKKQKQKRFDEFKPMLDHSDEARFWPDKCAP